MTSKLQLAKVVHLSFDDDSNVFEVVINRGSDDNVKEGDRYIIYGVGDSIHDPETGENLGKLELVRGRGRVVHTQDRLAHVRCTEKGEAQHKKITKKGAPLTMRIFEVDTVEEEVSASNLPFVGVCVGDHARKIY